MTSTDNAKKRKREKLTKLRSIKVPKISLEQGCGSVDIDRFVQARVFEIGAMEKALSLTKSGIGKRAFQSLPRFLRRRAASHNPNRIPLRLRERHVQETKSSEVQKKSASKKKRPHNRTFKRRARAFLKKRKQLMRGKWLDTHIWHAKRMHMKEMWGVKVALRPTNKNRARMMRSAWYGRLMHDASYMRLFEIDAVNAVSVFGVNAPSPSETKIGKRAGFKEWYYKQHRMGPIMYLWALDGKKIVFRAWIHPSMLYRPENQSLPILDELIGILRPFEKTQSYSNWSMFGPAAFALLYRNFELVDDATLSDISKDVWHGLGRTKCIPPFPKGSVLSFRIQPKMSLTSDSMQTDDVPLTSVEMNRLILAAHKSAPPKSIWKNNDEDTQKDKETNIILIANSISSSASKKSLFYWTVILPSSTSRLFWSHIHSRAHPLVCGIDLIRSLHVDASALCIPYDFAGSHAFETYWDEVHMEKMGKEEKKPRAKKVAYTKLGVSSPFRPNFAQDLEMMKTDDDVSKWSELHSGEVDVTTLNQGRDKLHVPIAFETVKKGRPEPCAEIHVPVSKDLYKKLVDSKLAPHEFRPERDALGVFKNSEFVRVGYVTSAGYSQMYGKGNGIGTVTRESLLLTKLFQENGYPFLLWFRNPSSCVYYPISIRIIR